MSSRKGSSLSIYSNPENEVQLVKMQSLLEQYDRENQYLNKQVLDLLAINRLLGRKKRTDYEQPVVRQSIYTSIKEDSKGNSKRYQYLTEPNDHQNSQKINQLYNTITKVAEGPQKKRGAGKNKNKVKFTCGPYIGNGETSRQEGSRSRSKSRSNDKRSSAESSPRRGQIEVTLSPSKSKKDEEAANLSKISGQSRLSNKSRKSGISVLSKEKQQQSIIKEDNQSIKHSSPAPQRNIESLSRIELPMTASENNRTSFTNTKQNPHQLSNTQLLNQATISRPQSLQKCIQTSPRHIQTEIMRPQYSNPFTHHMPARQSSFQSQGLIKTSSSTFLRSGGSNQRHRHQITPSKINVYHENVYENNLHKRDSSKKKKYIKVYSNSIEKRAVGKKFKPFMMCQ